MKAFNSRQTKKITEDKYRFINTCFRNPYGKCDPLPQLFRRSWRFGVLSWRSKHPGIYTWYILKRELKPGVLRSELNVRRFLMSLEQSLAVTHRFVLYQSFEKPSHRWSWGPENRRGLPLLFFTILWGRKSTGWKSVRERTILERNNLPLRPLSLHVKPEKKYWQKGKTFL